MRDWESFPASPEVSSAPLLTVQPHPQSEPGVWCVRVAGELDLATAPLLSVELHLVLAVADTVLVDLTEVAFLDAVGLTVLLTAQTAARRQNKRLRVVAAHRAVRRVVDLFDLAPQLGLPPDPAGVPLTRRP